MNMFIPKPTKALTSQEIKASELRHIQSLTTKLENSVSFENLYTLLPSIKTFNEALFSKEIEQISQKVSSAYSKSIRSIENIEVFRSFITDNQLNELPLEDDAQSKEDFDHSYLNISKEWLLKQNKAANNTRNQFMYHDIDNVFSKALSEEDFSDVTTGIHQIIIAELALK